MVATIFRATAAFAIFVVLSLRALPGRAEEPTGTAAVATTEANVIEVVVVGRNEALERVRDALPPKSFAPMALRWVWRASWDSSQLIDGANEDREVRLRCWLVLSNARHAHLYFADQAQTRFLIRDLDLSGRLDELDREALSQALESSIRALLEDHTGLDREEARSLLQPKANVSAPVLGAVVARPEPARVPSRLFAGGGWHLASHSRQLGWVQGPLLVVGYEHPLGDFRAGVWVNGQFELRESYRGPLAGLTLQTFGLYSGARLVRSLFAERTFVGVVLGGGVDSVQFAARPGLLPSAVALTPERSLLLPALTGGALWGAELTSHARLSLEGRLSLPLLRAHYDVDVGGARERIVSPWLVRPSVAIALELH